MKITLPKKQVTARATLARREKRIEARVTKERSQPQPSGSRPAQPARSAAADADTFNNRGDAFYDSEQYEKAIEAYKQAVRLDPDYAEAYNSLAMPPQPESQR